MDEVVRLGTQGTHAMSLGVLYWLGVAVLAAYVGWKSLADDVTQLRSVVRTLGVTLLWLAGWQTLLALAYLGLRTQSAVLYELQVVLLLSATAAIIWIPVGVIAYLGRALRERR